MVIHIQYIDDNSANGRHRIRTTIPGLNEQPINGLLLIIQGAFQVDFSCFVINNEDILRRGSTLGGEAVPDFPVAVLVLVVGVDPEEDGADRSVLGDSDAVRGVGEARAVVVGV